MMNLDLPERLIPVRDKIDHFVKTKIDPVADEYYQQVDVGDRWTLTDRQIEILDELKNEARGAGLWNFFLPKSQGALV
jgi:acyl-CoA dehydrogenase